MVEINLHAVIHGTKEAMRRMKPRGTGHIVNVASSAGKTGFPHLATYCATKHGVVGLSEAVRAELRGTGVEISVVMPNIVNTELSAGLVETPAFKPSTVDEVADAVIDALQSRASTCSSEGDRPDLGPDEPRAPRARERSAAR